MPRCGRVVPDLKDYSFREVIYVHYRIVYRITNNDNIEILTILNGAGELMTALRQEWDLSLEDGVSMMQEGLGDRPR